VKESFIEGKTVALKEFSLMRRFREAFQFPAKIIYEMKQSTFCHY